METPTAEVRGLSAFRGRPSWEARTGARLLDTAWVIAIYALILRLTDASPIPHRTDIFGLLALGLAWFALQYALFGGTVGQWTWRLSRTDSAKKRIRWLLPNSFFKSELLQEALPSRTSRSTAVFLTLVTFLACGYTLRETYWKHPLLAQADIWDLKAYVPSTPEAQASWRIAPYFFALGAWPKSFDGHPILYSLPYAKGPPTQFIPEIVARWEMPEVKLTIEGPKTPDAIDPEVLRDCLTSHWERTSCLRIREASLLRHVQLARGALGAPKRWKVRWFEVDNPSLPPSDRPRGIFLSAEGRYRSQDRFILITPKGAHQAFVLDRPNGPQGDLARMMFEQAIRSQRVSGELTAGRAWVDRELSATRMDDLLKMEKSDAQFIDKVAEIQSLLLSKISVEPRTFDAYYHLGGTALLLARRASQYNRTPTSQSAVLPGEGSTEWSAVALPMAQSAWRYAKDINPGDPRTAQLEDIWLDTKKF